MKSNIYYLIENGKVLHYSGDFHKLLNYTTDTNDAKIYYNNKLIWAQKPERN